MENNRYFLRLADFRKMVRLIVSYVGLNIAAFLLLIFMIEGGTLNKTTFPLELLLIIFFVVFAVGFIWLQKRNTSREEISTDSGGIHSSRYGTLLFNDMKTYQVFRSKRREDVILLFHDGRKIMFGPVDFRKSQDQQTYKTFKTFITAKLPSKNQLP